MATSAQVAIETYLKTSYHPDRDYVWVIDPASQTGFDWIQGWHEIRRFEAAGTPIFLDVREIFESLQR